MLKILRKSPIPIKSLTKSQEIQKLKINPAFIRTILDFDGSMTKFIMNLSEGQSKPLIKIIQEKQRTLDCNFCQQSSTQVDGLSTLQDLRKVFNLKKDSQKEHNSFKQQLIERSIEFYIVNETLQSSPKPLYFARSFWSKQKYNQIMLKAKHKPIGLNLIQQQVQIFRKINWTGIVDLQVTFSGQKNQSLVYRDLCSRSYSMLNNGEPLCELEEFFLPATFDIFKQTG